jgi:hypothetical protein
MVLATLALALAAAGDPACGAVTCPSGRLVRVRTLERSEGIAGGPSPALPDARPPSRPGGALHFLTFACGPRSWEARVAAAAPGLRPEDLRPRDGVSFRVEGETLYVERPDETELALRVSTPRGRDGEAAAPP